MSDDAPKLIGMVQLPAAKMFASGDGPPKWEEKGVDLAFDTEGRAWYLVRRLEKLPGSYVRMTFLGWRLAADLPFDPQPAGASVERRPLPFEDGDPENVP